MVDWRLIQELIAPMIIVMGGLLLGLAMVLFYAWLEGRKR